MTAISRTQVTKPANFQDFEKQCAVWWELKLDDRNLHRYGRNGQRQNGVDIYGIRDGDVLKGVGIQCKLKDDHAELTEKEVKDECLKALNFDPPLSEFHIVTTSPNDVKLQSLAARLSVEQAKAGRTIRFLVMGWSSVTDDLARYPDALLAFDDTYGVFGRQTLERIDTGFAMQGQASDAILAKITAVEAKLTLTSAVDATVEVASAVEAKLDAEIDTYRDMINDRQLEGSLALLKKLLHREEATASGRILFRIKANIGAAHLNLGHEVPATDWLLAAYDHAPMEPKAIANKALAHLLRGEWDEVLRMGRENLTSEAADDSLSSHVIQAARFADYHGDPLALVPEAHRETDGVLLALAHFQRKRNDRSWRATARKASERFPDEPHARQLAAEAELDEIIGENGLLHWNNVGPEIRARLSAATAVLRELWEEAKASEGVFDEQDMALCGNLILAYRAQGEYGPALETIRFGLTLDAADGEFRTRAALTAMEAGDPLAEELVPTLEEGPVKNLLIVQLAVSKGNWSAISHYVPEDGETFPESERSLCLAALKLARIDNLPPAHAAKSLSELLEDVRNDVRACVVIAQYCDNKGHAGLAGTAWQYALGSIDDDAHVSARLMAAMYAFRHERWTAVADLLFGHIALDRDDQELRALCSALVQERPVKERAVEFFRSLPDDLRARPRYRYFEGLMNFNRGDLAEAERIFGEEMDRRPTLNILSMLIMVRRRSNRSTEIPELLAAHDLDRLEGAPEERIVIAHELRRVGRDEEALGIAYPVFRDNPNSAEVAVGYATLMFSIRENREFLAASRVEVGTWVRLSRRGDRDFEFLLEEGPDDPAGGRLSPTHPLAVLALGKSVGDEFTLVQAFGDEIVWKVAEIRHRYVHALKEILENFESKYPGATGMYSVTMEDGDISKILEHVRLLAERGEKAVDLHVRSHLPFQLAAGAAKENPVSFAMAVAELGREIRTSSGMEHDRITAYTVIAEHAGKGVVLDAHAAWTVASLDLIDVVKTVLGPMHIPRSAMDDLLTFRGFRESQFLPELSLVHRDGQYFKTERDEAAVEARDLYVAQQIEKIEKACVVSPVVAPNTLGKLEDLVLEFCGERVLDPVFLCAGGRLLLCEDLKYRAYARQIAHVKSVWLQAVLLYARGTGVLDETRYADALVSLSAHRHGTLSMDSRVMKSVLKSSADGSLRRLEALAGYIGNRGFDPDSHCGVVIEFINGTSGDEDIDPLLRQRAISMLMRHLVRHSGRRWRYLVEAVSMEVSERDADFLDGWVRGHFLDRNALYAVRRAFNLYAFARSMTRQWANREMAIIPNFAGGHRPPPSSFDVRKPTQARAEIPRRRKHAARRRRKRA